MIHVPPFRRYFEAAVVYGTGRGSIFTIFHKNSRYRQTDKPQKTQAVRPAFFTDSAFLSTCRPCRRRVPREREASSSQAPHPSLPPCGESSLAPLLVLSPPEPPGSGGDPLCRQADKPEPQKTQAFRPAFFIDSAFLSTCRPCRRRVPREQEARACRLPGTRWSGPWRRQRRRSAGQSGSPLQGR